MAGSLAGGLLRELVQIGGNSGELSGMGNCEQTSVALGFKESWPKAPVPSCAVAGKPPSGKSASMFKRMFRRKRQGTAAAAADAEADHGFSFLKSSKCGPLPPVPPCHRPSV